MTSSWECNRSGNVQFCNEDKFPTRLRFLRWVGRQTWLPVGQDYLLRTIANPDTCAPFLFEIDFFGFKYRGDLAHFLDWTVFCYGGAPLSELTVLEEMARQVRIKRAAPISFVDVGANAGHHTLFMAGIVDNVLAIEPLSSLRALISEKILINGLKNVCIAPFGLGERDEIRDYHVGEGRNSGVGKVLLDDAVQKGSAIKVEIRNGDSYLDQLKFGKIDLMKIDVEGFEAFVLRGLRERIMKDRPVVLMELSDLSREHFGGEHEFRKTFYEGARFATVAGRLGQKHVLYPFVYSTSDEVLIIPPELGNYTNVVDDPVSETNAGAIV